jgi:DNA-binding MarR family transcriptional regulator
MGDIYEAKTYEPRQAVGSLLNRVRVALMDALEAELAEFGVTAAQYVIFVSLSDGWADSASSICRTISYDPGAMTRMLDRLEQKGFLRRVPSPEDRRATRLELTPEGKALYPKLKASAMKVANRFLRGFTKAEAKQLEEFLRRMLENA